jgi:hypothetical protein
MIDSNAKANANTKTNANVNANNKDNDNTIANADIEQLVRTKAEIEATVSKYQVELDEHIKLQVVCMHNLCNSCLCYHD